METLSELPLGSPHKGTVTQALMGFYVSLNKRLKKTVELPVIWDAMTPY